MAADKKGKGTIVIKRVYVTAAGHHGGAWKVAFADFMTAMMAFFLVMWLVAQSEQTKKNVSDYFSTPSLIEYNFSNFGVEITLEKLFLDFVNEPLKAFAQFMEPMDKTPSILDTGSQKATAAYMADKLQDLVIGKKNMSIGSDSVEFDILDDKFFVPGKSTPNVDFVANAEKLKSVTEGLEEAELNIEVRLFNESVEGSNPELAQNIARERLDLLRDKIQAGLEHSTVSVNGAILVVEKKGFIEGQSQRPRGLVHISMKQKETRSDGKKKREMKTAFGQSESNMDVYQNFVQQVSKQKKKAQ